MDAHYVILELLAGIRSARSSNTDNNIDDQNPSTAEPTAKLEQQWSAFRQAVSLLRECPAKMLILQALL